jgi:hypothetical protein
VDSHLVALRQQHLQHPQQPERQRGALPHHNQLLVQRLRHLLLELGNLVAVVVD